MYAELGKRSIDVTLAAIGLIAFAPILLVCAVVVRATLGTPIIFRQQRPGLGGRLFTIYKFRTMRNVGETETAHTDESRLTEIGRCLRSTSLDELPELWNVLLGDMSLVGPRPLLPQYLNRYSPFQARRHEVRPGITGWAQINGRNAIDWDSKLAMDVWYVDHMSLRLDVTILVLTIHRVLRRRDIDANGFIGASEFKRPQKIEPSE